MATTARDIVRDALRLIGVVPSGDALSAEDLSDGLKSLNRMLSRWSIDNLLVFFTTREEFDLIPGQQAYTMGASGDFDTARPARIQRASILHESSTPSYETPLEIITMDEWADERTKSLDSNLPVKIYPEGTFPLETINVWPKPTEAKKIVIYSQKPLAVFTANTDVELPPGYEDAITYNLAVRLAPEYGKPVDMDVRAAAADYKADIMRINSKPVYLECDGVLVRRSDFTIFSGE